MLSHDLEPTKWQLWLQTCHQPTSTLLNSHQSKHQYNVGLSAHIHSGALSNQTPCKNLEYTLRTHQLHHFTGSKLNTNALILVTTSTLVPSHQTKQHAMQYQLNTPPNITHAWSCQVGFNFVTATCELNWTDMGYTLSTHLGTP